MQLILLVVHLMLTLALIGVVLLQRSEGGALGIGGGGMSGFMTGRATANLLTRTTAVLAALFFVTSISLAWISAGTREKGPIVKEQPARTAPVQPAPPAQPEAPSAPVR